MLARRSSRGIGNGFGCVIVLSEALRRGRAVPNAAVGINSQRAGVDLPDRVKGHVSIRGVGAAGGIIGCCGGIARGPAEEVISRECGHGGAEREIDSVEFLLRGGSAGTAVCVIRYIIYRIDPERIIACAAVLELRADKIRRSGRKGRIGYGKLIAAAAVVVRFDICCARSPVARIGKDHIGIGR